MSEQIRELQSQIERLESRLATAKSDLACIRERSRKSRGALPLILPLIAVSTALVVAAAPPEPQKFMSGVSAPFRVFDPASNRNIFEVSDATSDHPRGFALLDVNEKPLALGVAQEGKSVFEAVSQDGAAEAAMGVANPGFQVAGFNLKYGGQPRLSMGVTDGEPTLNMTNESNVGIVLAGQGENGGGYLLLDDAQGNPMVKFSTSANGAGTVVTYPNGGAGGAIVGLKGSMLCGQGGCKQ
jgi:hypothetical protein